MTPTRTTSDRPVSAVDLNCYASSRGPQWAKRRNTHCEQMFSALHPKADVRRLTPRLGRPVMSSRQPYAPSINVLVRVATEIAG
jgi:hypothetical protein